MWDRMWEPTKKRPERRLNARYLAEAVRFELTNGCPLPVFKTGAIDHSATPPWHYRTNRQPVCELAGREGPARVGIIRNKRLPAALPMPEKQQHRPRNQLLANPALPLPH